MPKLSAAPKAVATQEVKLEPKLKAKLLKEMKTYAMLEAQYEVLGAALAKSKDKAADLLSEAGVKKVKIDGHTAFTVEGTYSFLDKTKLIALGVTTEMLEEATVTRPKSPYTRIIHPASKNTKED